MDFYHYIDEWRPVNFYYYPHYTQLRICSSDDRELNDEMRKMLIEHFNEHGIHAYVDNKTVFELVRGGIHVFIGFYDGIMSLGFAVNKLN